jgi:hypothetical protein
MKNFYLVTLSCLSSLVQSYAQNGEVYRPFQVAMNSGIAFQATQTGVIFNINPSYTFHGLYKAGIQFEAVIYDMTMTGSSVLTFDYYFIRSQHFRVTAGGGFGFYNNSVLNGGCGGNMPPEMSEIQTSTGKMGGLIRLGFEWHHLCFGFAYHFVPTTSITTSENDLGTTTAIYKNGYWGITLGFMLGGGKK